MLCSLQRNPQRELIIMYDGCLVGRGRGGEGGERMNMTTAFQINASAQHHRCHRHRLLIVPACSGHTLPANSIILLTQACMNYRSHWRPQTARLAAWRQLVKTARPALQRGRQHSCVPNEAEMTQTRVFQDVGCAAEPQTVIRCALGVHRVNLRVSAAELTPCWAIGSFDGGRCNE